MFVCDWDLRRFFLGTLWLFQKSFPFPSVFIFYLMHEIFPFSDWFQYLIPCPESHQRLYLLFTSCINLNISCNFTWQEEVKAFHFHLLEREEHRPPSNQPLQVFFSHRSNTSIRMPGTLFEGGPCTPFDPAPLGPEAHVAQIEELVSTPMFIQQVWKEQ